MKKPTVTYYHRKPYSGHWSIEYIFKNLRLFLEGKIVSRVKVAKYTSNGLFKRIYIAIEAIFCQSEVNHITGDIHYVATFLKKSRTILTIHDCGILKDPSKIKRTIFYLFWYYIPSVRVRYITAVSEFSKKELLEYLPSLNPEKIIVIPSAVSDNFHYKPKQFNKEKPAILQIGTAHNKNLFRLAEALNGISCMLTIVGVLNEEQRNSLLQHRVAYRAVSNISEEEMIREYADTDLLAFVSTNEGFGMPIIEANRTGRAVITSSCASMPEVARDAALLVDPYNVAAIREGILKIINDDQYRESLVQQGLSNAERFKNDVISQQYLSLYNQIANK